MLFKLVPVPSPQHSSAVQHVMLKSLCCQHAQAHSCCLALQDDGWVLPSRCAHLWFSARPALDGMTLGSF